MMIAVSKKHVMMDEKVLITGDKIPNGEFVIAPHLNFMVVPDGNNLICMWISDRPSLNILRNYSPPKSESWLVLPPETVITFTQTSLEEK